MKRDWLITLRKNKNLTQADVADSIFIDRAYYSQIESGTRNPSVDISRNLAKVLDINPSLLLSDLAAFQEVFTRTQCMLAHSDLDMRYTWIFDSANQEEVNQFIGARDDELSFCIDSQKLISLKQRVLDTKETSGTFAEYEYNNEVHTHYIVGYPLLGEEGELIGIGTFGIKINALGL
jgi:transcriptional regulator with XRE-family HTH domain